MDPLHETRSRESIISAAKKQVQQERSISTRKDEAGHAAELPEVGNSPVPLENRQPRTVPAHVSRRTNGNTRALPPPSTSSSSKFGSQAKTDKESRKDKQIGNNSDSESEDDRKKRRRIDNEDARVLQRKAKGKMTDVGASGFNSSTSSYLTSEEQQRIRLRGGLRAAEEKWKQFGLVRKEYRSQRPDREYELILKKLRTDPCKDETKEDQMWKKVREYDERLRDYYDEALFNHIEQLPEDHENEVHMPSNPNIYLADIIKSVEDQVIVQLEALNTYPSRSIKWKTMPCDEMDRLISVYQQTVERMFEYMNPYDNSDIRTIALGRISLWHVKALSYFDTKKDALVDQYLITFFERLREAILPSEWFQLNPQQTFARNFSPVIAIDWAEFIRAVRSSLDSEEIIKRCERQHFLNQWPVSKFQLARKQGLIRQEFIENLDQSVGVSLALFKGTMLAGVQDVPSSIGVSLALFKDTMFAGIQDVPLEKLAWLGWKRNSYKSNYWRYCVGYNRRDEIFKVQMDGKIVGIWTVEGDVNWDESRDNPRELRLQHEGGNSIMDFKSSSCWRDLTENTISFFSSR